MSNFVIFGKGNGGGTVEGAVRYDVPQELTAEQKQQAQENLGIDLSANLKREIVETLPATGESNIIYMVSRTEAEEGNVYDEYMYINNAWEKIGSTDVDLSDYYTKEEIDEKLEDKRKTFYLDIMNTTSYEAKMQAAEIAQYAIQNQTTDFDVIGLNGQDNTLTSTEISTNGINELTINFQWGNGREIVTLTATSPTNINITRDGVTFETLQDIEENYYTKEEADDKFLTEHQEIKTINGESIVGSGDIEIKGFSGDYNDLTNKPVILNHWFGTQAEYDAIAEKDPNTIYHIEGGGIDVDDYYTKSEVYNKSEIDEKLDGINNILETI